jgi:hypothetical protein
MFGTMFFLLSIYTRYVGLLFLILAVPLSYESIRSIMKRYIVYVTWDSSNNRQNQISVDHPTLTFWSQVSGLGSHQLIVGIPSKTKQSDKIAKLVRDIHYVHAVIVDAPTKIDLIFLEQVQIDYVMVNDSRQIDKYVTDEVLRAKRVCIIDGDDGIVRILDANLERKKE